MRIHLMINQYALEFGGAERVVQCLHAGLRERGIESFILGLTVGDIDVQYAYSVGCRSPYQYQAFNALRRYIKKNVKQSDIIHAHLFPTNLYLSLLKKMGCTKAPLVCTEHSTSNRRRKKLIGRMLDTFTYMSYDRIMTISEGTEQTLLDWKPELANKTRVLINGTRLAFDSIIQRKNKNRLTILSVGSLRSAKNYQAAINAVSLLKNIDCEYQIAGSGPNLDVLKQQCRDLGLESKVRFLGYIEDVSTYLVNADIFLMPSKWEGFGLAAVEAMNASLPVVVSDVAGLREIVDHNPPCALLVNPESPESIANALWELLGSYEARFELGRNGFKRSQYFKEDKMIEQYLTIYSEILTDER